MIAGVILAETIEDAIRKIRLHDADLFELRVDKLVDFSGIEDLSNYSSRLIITIRKREEGGFREFKEEERLELFKKFLTLKPRYVDIELNSEIRDEVIALARKHGSGVILSYHNFRETPPFERLVELVKVMEGYSPDVMKIVTYARDMKDNITVIKLYEIAENLVAFCMGSKGRLSRIFSAVYSPFTYASLEESAAPGQLTVEEVREIMRIIGG
ncbi:3-dehydroquinate dehydratase [Pyrococcus sp. NA2]|uniref:3-dehydroquinate dehydratase n=1 Tax=Pyrococcus sp. (strain NA2) TaxID=342949 RepID=UPI000209A8EF|nr:3-dehydroquinate dehydratase [Pyrococcus sp. NA2]AEC51237.1 3-dehydroquinate dehydratase [Pyrococcus sp. NA2]